MTVPVPPPPPPARTLRPWVAGAAIAVVLVATLVAVVVLRPAGGDGSVAAPTATPAPAPSPSGTDAPPRTPTPAPTPTPTSQTSPAPPGGTASPLPGPRPDGIEQIAAQVAAIRALPLRGELDARVVAPPDLGAKLAELSYAEHDREQVALDGRLLTALRLLDPGDDLAAIVEAFYREQILGLYVMEEQVLYIGGDDPELSAGQRVTAAHEIVHALQDRAFDLDRFMDSDEAEADAQLAALALVEGDAVLSQELWAVRHQTSQEREEALGEAGGRPSEALAASPPYVRDTLLFPYREGFRFVQALFEQGGFAAVDAAFEDPPSSTRHILRPETYLAGEQHSEVTITAAPGEGWEEASTYTFGEFDVGQWLAPLGEAAAQVTATWDGGLTRHWQRADGDAVALALRLGTPGGAAAACAAVPTWYEAVAGGQEEGERLLRGDRDWMAWTCDSGEVRLGLAPDADTARLLAQP